MPQPNSKKQKNKMIANQANMQQYLQQMMSQKQGMQGMGGMFQDTPVCRVDGVATNVTHTLDVGIVLGCCSMGNQHAYYTPSV